MYSLTFAFAQSETRIVIGDLETLNIIYSLLVQEKGIDYIEFREVRTGSLHKEYVKSFENSDFLNPNKDVHTEHCCIHCRCKYGENDCPVMSGKKKQSFPCRGDCGDWY